MQLENPIPNREEDYSDNSELSFVATRSALAAEVRHLILKLDQVIPKLLLQTDFPKVSKISLPKKLAYHQQILSRILQTLDQIHYADWLDQRAEIENAIMDAQNDLSMIG